MCTHILAPSLVESLSILLLTTLILEPRLSWWFTLSIGWVVPWFQNELLFNIRGCSVFFSTVSLHQLTILLGISIWLLIILFIGLGHVVCDSDFLCIKRSVEFVLQIFVWGGLDLLKAMAARILMSLSLPALEFLLALNQHFDCFCYNSYSNNLIYNNIISCKYKIIILIQSIHYLYFKFI